MTTYDLDRMFGEWADSAAAIAEPRTLLPEVFAVTRTAAQRRGWLGRLQIALRGGSTSAMSLRPALTYALLILLLAVMAVALAVGAGMLKPRIPAGWRSLDTDVPSTTSVSQVSRFPGGFMAIGTSQLLEPDCATGADRGRVWTSVNGDSWIDRSGEAFRNLQPSGAFTTNEWIYVVGTDSVCYDENGVGDDPRVRVLRSSDGASWDDLPADEIFQWGNVPLVADLGSELVAIGPYQEPLANGEFAEDRPTTWTSPDGVAWERRATLEDVRHITSLQAKDGTLVALGEFADEPRIVILTSTDAGRSWTTQDLPGSVPSSLAFLAADDQRFVAAGDDAAIVSTDGLTWTPANSANGALNGVTDLFAVPGGFLVLREDRADSATVDVCVEVGGPAMPMPSGSSLPEWTPNPSPEVRCSVEALGGGTSFSRDGLEWASGPDLPVTKDASSGDRFNVAVGENDLVATESSRLAEVWYSPLSTFVTSD